MKTLDIVRDAVKDWIGNEEKENSRATIGINDEDVLEASGHMKAIMEIMEKYKEQQCLKDYINSYSDCITG